MRRKTDILFVIYILTVLILAVIYFTVPERRMFLENQLEWWREFCKLIKSLG